MGKRIKDKKIRIILLILFASILALSGGFFAFSAYVMFYVFSSYGNGGMSFYALKKSDIVFFNGQNGFRLLSPGFANDFHISIFYYIFMASLIIFLVASSAMFVYFYRFINKHGSLEAEIESLEKNALEIPSAVIHEIKGNINALGINSRLLREKLIRSGGGKTGEENGSGGNRKSFIKNEAGRANIETLYAYETPCPNNPEDSPGCIADIARISGAVESEISRLNETMENILRFTKEHSLNMEKVYLKDLINKAVEKSAPKAAAEGVFIITGQAVDGGACITADAALMEQVLVNLISNAIESYQNNRKPITSSRNKADGDKTSGSENAKRGVFIYCYFYVDKIIISIEDNGKGISKEFSQRICEPFFTTKKNGVGLGLSLVKKILDAHGFKIKVESAAFAGTKAMVIIKNLEN